MKLTHKAKVVLATVAIVAFAGLFAEHSLASNPKVVGYSTNPKEELLHSSRFHPNGAGVSVRPNGRDVVSSPVPAVSSVPKVVGVTDPAPK